MRCNTILRYSSTFEGFFHQPAHTCREFSAPPLQKILAHLSACCGPPTDIYKIKNRYAQTDLPVKILYSLFDSSAGLMIISIAVFHSTKCHQSLLIGAKIQSRQFSYGAAHLDCCQVVIIRHSRKHGIVLRSTQYF